MVPAHERVHIQPSSYAQEETPVEGDLYINLKNEWQLDKGEGGREREVNSR